jgi:hypothetical protein
MRRGPSREPGASAPCHDRHLETTAGDEHLAYLVLRARQDHQHGFLPKHAEAVALVRMQLLVAR